YCKDEAMRDVKVELMERDVGEVFAGPLDPNEYIGHVHTNSHGRFTISGVAEELSKIEPYIRITHNCATEKRCVRILEIDIPDSFINAKPWHMEPLELSKTR
ncbi:hypothetical protein PFISCL1PPCAC_27130, partial [Pristionchus fissidentatus]